MTGTAGLILVVEDERQVREPLVHLLRNRQYEVLTADTAEAALELLRVHRPDAGIIDLHLGQGSGRDVVVRMPPLAPVIIFSGMASASGELERLRPRTVLAEKPCSLTWLIHTLEDMLAKTREFASR